MLLECKNCEAIVNAEEICNYSIKVIETEYLIEVLIVYRLLKCPKCERPLLTMQQSIENEKLNDPTPIYPPSGKQVNPSLPKPLKSSYQEALQCFKARAFTASAIMCRKTVEGICDEHGIEPGRLKNRLEKMKENGIIENRLFEWAEVLRDSGNKAAHEINITISRQDASDIIDFTDALLEYVFTLNDKFNEFQARRLTT